MYSTCSLLIRSQITIAEAVLEQAAKDGSFDITEWPRTLGMVLERLDHIAFHEFPTPSIQRPIRILRPPFDPNSSSPLYGPKRDQMSDTASDQAEPRTSPPSSISPPTPAARAAPATPREPSTAIDLPEGTLPPPLLATLTFVKHSLETNFRESPPHTIQRLAELILRPKQHYRYLPAYLNALDRIVAVSSGTTLFPLPSSEAAAAGSTFVNGNTITTPTVPAFTLGSDESLGGALLTPIPWLRTGHSNGSAQSSTQANGAGDSSQDSTSDTDTIMTTDDPASTNVNASSNSGSNTLRSNGAITQGELLRQEQESSDPPAALASAQNHTHILRGDTTNANEMVSDDKMDAEADIEANGNDAATRDVSKQQQQQQQMQPHARGPGEIGMADTGKQELHTVGGAQVLDMEAAVGRSASSTSPSSSSMSPISATTTSATASETAPAVANADADSGKENSREVSGVENKQQDEVKAEAEAEEGKTPLSTSIPLPTPEKDEEGDTLITDADGAVPEDLDPKMGAVAGSGSGDQSDAPNDAATVSASSR